ncbi:bestrophin family ion channel [Microcoleus sp. MON1_C1]
MSAFLMAIKQHLRYPGFDNELKKSVLYPEQCLGLQYVTNMPLKVRQRIGGYLTKQYTQKHVDSLQFASLNRLLDQLVECLYRGERILAAPMPKAYSIHLRHLLLLYCLVLPFQMVKDLQWWTIPVVGIVSFGLFGVEAIGLEVENPFGYDANNFPLNRLCKKLHNDTEELIAAGTKQDSIETSTGKTHIQ